jgi:hypothetical protein
VWSPESRRWDGRQGKVPQQPSSARALAVGVWAVACVINKEGTYTSISQHDHSLRKIVQRITIILIKRKTDIPRSLGEFMRIRYSNRKEVILYSLSIGPLVFLFCWLLFLVSCVVSGFLFIDGWFDRFILFGFLVLPCSWALYGFVGLLHLATKRKIIFSEKGIRVINTIPWNNEPQKNANVDLRIDVFFHWEEVERITGEFKKSTEFQNFANLYHFNDFIITLHSTEKAIELIETVFVNIKEIFDELVPIAGKYNIPISMDDTFQNKYDLNF